MGEPMRKLKIAFADDDPDVRELVTDELTHPYRDHHLTVVQNGVDLLSLVNAPDIFDVVITDYHMSGGPNGLEVMRHLRLRGFKGSIILHTADDSEELRAAVASLGGLYSLKYKPLYALIDSLAK